MVLLLVVHVCCQWSYIHVIAQINSDEVSCIISSYKSFDLCNHRAVLFCDYICID